MDVKEISGFLNQFVQELDVVVVDTNGEEVILPIKLLEYNKLEHRVEIVV